MNCGRSLSAGVRLVLGDAGLMRHLAVLAVQLGQRLDVVAGERDRHHQQVLDCPRAPSRRITFSVLGPSHRTGPDLRLEGQQVRVGPLQPLDHRLHARADLLRVGVAAVDHVERQASGR